MNEDRRTTGLSNVVKADDERIRDHLGRIVRGTVEETLKALLDVNPDGQTVCQPRSHRARACRKYFRKETQTPVPAFPKRSLDDINPTR